MLKQQFGCLFTHIRLVGTVLLLVCSFLLTTSSSLAGNNVWTTHGPYGGYIEALIIDPATPATLYAGTTGGVYKSTDSGVNWSAKNNGLTDTFVTALAIDPVTPNTLYAGTFHSGDIFKSTDGGNNWTAISNGLTGASIRVLIVDPLTSNTLYAGTDDGVFKSADGGASWVNSSSGLTISNGIQALIIDPTNSNTLYAGDIGVFKSIDGGSSWTAINTGLTDLNVRSLAVDPVTSTTIYMGSGKVFKSTNGGTSWSASDTGLPGVSVLDVAINPTTPAILYAGTIQGVYKSTNGGVNWSASKTGLNNLDVKELVLNPNTSSILYAGTVGGGIYKSTDSGANWLPSNSGLPAIVIDSLSINPVTPTTLFAGSQDAGVYKSIDSGSNWFPVNSGLNTDEVYSLAIDPVAPTTLYAGGLGIYKSTDGGANWFPINTGLTNFSIFALAINPSTPATLYAGTAGGVFKSTNGGVNWSAINSGLTNLSIDTLAIDPIAPTVLYAGTDGGVFKSINGGAGWFATSTGLSNLNVDALAIDPVTPSNLYAGTYGGGVFKSTDNGANWFPVNSGLTISYVNNVTIDPASPTILYVGGRFGQGIAKSRDGGQSWTAMNTGLTNLSIDGFVIDPINPVKLYAGTGSGVYDFQEITNPDSYEPDNTSTQANWLTSGSPQTHSIIPANDVDWVKFTLAAESEVVIETSGASGDTRMWLYDSSLTQLDFDDDGNGLFSRISRTCNNNALAAGTYYVKIDEYLNDNEIDSYDISLTTTKCPDSYEPDNTSTQANWIFSDSPQTHSIIPANDIDWIKFSVSAESEIVIETSGASGDTRMWLYDSSLAQIDFDDDGNGLFSRISRTCNTNALAAGTYYVKIDEYLNDNEIDSYDISLTTSVCANPILQVNPTSLNFTAAEGGSNPLAQSFTISNTGIGTLNWTATESLSWLNLNSTSGTAPATVNASVNISGLSAGTYNGQISVSGSGAQNSPQIVDVALEIDPPSPNVRYIDLTMSLYKTADTSAERTPYEEIFRYAADAIYEMSNGVHKIRNVTIYQNSESADSAHIIWTPSDWPRANVAGYDRLGWTIIMGDVFPFTNNQYNALAINGRRGAGYTLAHELGHYYYGLYDEYRGSDPTDNSCLSCPHTDDIPVPNSVMTHQWNAETGNFNWLNFSIAKNNTKKNAQHRVYGASGWETLARPTYEDPRDGQRQASSGRSYYQELTSVAPIGDEDASLELPAGQAQARSGLNINWISPGGSLTQQSFTYQVKVESTLGNQIEFPLPVALVASVSRVDPIAKAGISASVTTPDNSVTNLTLKDDGLAPDVLADDGFYSGFMPYNQGGNYLINVTFDNNAGIAEFTQIAYEHTPGPNGETPDLTPQPVGENFSKVATATISINNFQADDHADTPIGATTLTPNNIDIPGRIDRAGDIDVFKLSATDTGQLILRVSNLALGMRPKIRLLGSDGTTLIDEFNFTPQGNEYFFTPLNLQPGQVIYIEISHSNQSATTGYYDVSVGQALANGNEASNRVYLPIIIK